MLGKCIRHEFKATARMIPMLYIAIAALYGVGLLASFFEIKEIQGVTTIFVALGAVAVIFITIAMIVMRYHKSMFGNEGYLNQTLPVSPGKLLASKYIVSVIWYIASMIVLFLAIIGILFMFDVSLDEAYSAMKDLFGSSMGPMLVYLLASIIIQVFLFIAEVYFAITFANTKLFIKNNVLFAVVWYVAVTFVVQILDVIAMLVIPLSIEVGEKSVRIVGSSMLAEGSFISGGMTTVGIGTVFSEILCLVVLLIVTNWLLKRKVSVK